MHAISQYYDQEIVDMLLFMLFYVLFPRDQSFYLLVVINVCSYLNVLTKTVYHQPHLYYFPDIKINAPFCGHISGLSFGFPSMPLMLQMCIDSSMFLTIFYTSKNSNLTAEE